MWRGFISGGTSNPSRAWKDGRFENNINDDDDINLSSSNHIINLHIINLTSYHHIINLSSSHPIINISSSHY